MPSTTWPQVLAWRMRRQFLLEASGAGVVEVARRLAGIQAQVPSAASLAIAIRQARPRPGAVEEALVEERTLVRTWAMRGTLHLLPADEAGAYLAVAGAHRSWEKAGWQKAFMATPADLEVIAEAAAASLQGGVALTREELTTEIVERTGSTHLAELLGSGWGTLLKPLAWWGVLCHGPMRANRVTFVSPAAWLAHWQGIPEVDDAAVTVVRAYLGAHGPTTPDAFDRVWLSRGGTRKALLRGWFAALEDQLATVRVGEQDLVMLADDLPALLEEQPAGAVRLLGGFDPYVLGAGTDAIEVVPGAHRAAVSRPGGWIAPVVLQGGRAAGTWSLEDDSVEVALWDDVSARAVEAEVERLAAFLGRALSLTWPTDANS